MLLTKLRFNFVFLIILFPSIVEIVPESCVFDENGLTTEFESFWRQKQLLNHWVKSGKWRKFQALQVCSQIPGSRLHYEYKYEYEYEYTESNGNNMNHILLR